MIRLLLLFPLLPVLFGCLNAHEKVWPGTDTQSGVLIRGGNQGLFAEASENIQAFAVGDDDVAASLRIESINRVYLLWLKGDFIGSIDELNKMLTRSRNSSEHSVLLAIKAHVYTYLHIDIEKAVVLDQQINNSLDADFIQPRAISGASSGKILINPEFSAKFFTPRREEILEGVRNRLSLNRRLITGERDTKSIGLQLPVLISELSKIRRDLNRAPVGTSDYYRLLSRELKAEAEISKISGRQFSDYNAFHIFEKGIGVIDNIHFSEVDFLSLANYLEFIGEHYSRVDMLEHALAILMVPYTNIDQENTRFTYSKIVNRLTDRIIHAHFNDDNYSDVMRYISFNKSRIILEDKAISTNLSLNSARNERQSLLEIFNKKPLSILNSIEKLEYIDFYVEGEFSEHSDVTGVDLRYESSSLTRTTHNISALSTMDGASASKQVFTPTALYITHVLRDRIDLRRFERDEVERFLTALEEHYAQIGKSNSDLALSKLLDKCSERGVCRKGSLNDFIDTLGQSARQDRTRVMLSYDKSLAKYPIESWLGIDAIRTLNYLTVGRSRAPEERSIVGYFNPDGSLDFADKEAAAIRGYFNNAKLLERGDATVSHASLAVPADILHLSMHAQFDPVSPEKSYLVFAPNLDESPKLEARQIYNLPQFSNKDLIFAAACRTGRHASTIANQSEILGILRPLITNNNDYIILSLWDLNDKSAAFFVKSFYQNLSQSGDIEQAFFKARQIVREIYAITSPEKAFTHWAPYYLFKVGT